MKIQIIVPVYNESIEVVQKVIAEICAIFPDRLETGVVVVDDGSDEWLELSRICETMGVIFCRHSHNRGYGRSLRTGILAAEAPWIGIIDADSTYPVERLVELVSKSEHADMVLAVRRNNADAEPWIRRIAKKFLNLFASYFSGVRIRDVNTGMRLFRRELAYSLWGLFPNGFSFTTTLTVGAHLGGFRIQEIEVPYAKRSGKSSIHPFYDTLMFFKTVLRVGLLFHPMKLFGPIAVLLICIGGLKAILRDFPLTGSIGNFSVMFALAGVQILMMGVLAQLIVNSRTTQRDSRNS